MSSDQNEPCPEADEAAEPRGRRVERAAWAFVIASQLLLLVAEALPARLDSDGLGAVMIFWAALSIKTATAHIALGLLGVAAVALFFQRSWLALACAPLCLLVGLELIGIGGEAPPAPTGETVRLMSVNADLIIVRVRYMYRRYSTI